MNTLLIALGTLALWHGGRWVWTRMGHWDADALILTWRPRLIARREADQARDRALAACAADGDARLAQARAEWVVERDRAVAEALATLVEDPRTPEDAAEFKAVFERVHTDPRFQDYPPTQQAAAARRIQRLGAERLGFHGGLGGSPR